VLVAVPACHAPPRLPPFRYKVTSRRASLRTKRGSNLWVPNLVNMAGGILNSGSVSRYDVSLVMLQIHASRQQRVAFCSNFWLQLMPNHITVLSLLVVCLCSR
jgi:hypothetical protein